MNAIVQQPRGNSLAPRTFDEAVRFSEMLASTTMVPRDYQGKPANILVAIQWGMEVGLNPLQAVQNIAVINGRPSIWGDAALALVRGHPACAGVREGIDGTGDARHGWCEVTRRGEQPQRRTFSVADAKKAGLWNKPGPWQQYPDRMLQLRARGFAIRDVFPDALRGVITAEEAQDMPVVDVQATINPASTNEGMRAAKEDMIADGKAFRVLFPNGKDKLAGTKADAVAMIVKAAERCADRATLERLVEDNAAHLEWHPGYEPPAWLAEAREAIDALRASLPDDTSAPSPAPAEREPAGVAAPEGATAEPPLSVEPAAGGAQPGLFDMSALDALRPESAQAVRAYLADMEAAQDTAQHWAAIDKHAKTLERLAKAYPGIYADVKIAQQDKLAALGGTA